VKFKKTAILDEVDGVAASLTDAPFAVVDEYLPASGVANNDVFWVVVSGPCAVKTAASLSPGAAVTVGAGGEGVAGTAANAVGVAISPPASGFVRTLVNVSSGHAASAVAGGGTEPSAADGGAEPVAASEPSSTKSKK
jgi:hypothetical protein